MKKILPFFIILFLTGCRLNSTEDFIPYVKTAVIQYENALIHKTFQGFIDKGLDVELSFYMKGRIEKIYVNEGDFVKKGTLLARLDDKEYLLHSRRTRDELDDALVRYNRAKSYYERISKLHSAGGISYNDWEEAQTNVKISQNKIDILKSELEISKQNVEYAKIYAPYDGFIIKTYKDENQFAGQGEPVILFQGKGASEARVFVSQNDIQSVKIGQKVLLRADSINKKFRGVIKSKVNSSINTGAYRVTVSIDDFAGELLDGMSVDVFVDFDTAPLKIFVPINAIAADNFQNYLYVVFEEKGEFKVQKRGVETGEISNGRVEILKGVKSGEVIVMDGVDKIQDRSVVYVQNN